LQQSFFSGFLFSSLEGDDFYFNPFLLPTIISSADQLTSGDIFWKDNPFNPQS